jgi:YgiT-type zinc finger domain-containing protein
VVRWREICPPQTTGYNIACDKECKLAEAAQAEMNTDMSFNCPECGHRIEDGIIEMVFELRNTHVAVSNVPAKVCPNCGQEFVDGFVAENVNRLVDRVTEDVDSYAKKVTGSPRVQRKIAITA